jgi:hypothetical protein
MSGCRGGIPFANIALIDPGKFDRFVGNCLHGTR